jgi:hypothetical protein
MGDQQIDLIGALNHADDFDNAIADSGRVYSLYGNLARRLGTIDFNTTPSLEVRSPQSSTSVRRWPQPT